MAKLLNLFASPDRMGPSPHGNSNTFEIPEAFVHSGRVGPEPASVYHFTVFVECSVMALDVTKVNPDRIPTLELLRDFEMKYWDGFHAHSLSCFRKTFASHLPCRCDQLLA
jgi:hypothetical protein